VAKIQAIHDRVLFRQGIHKGELGDLVASLLMSGSRKSDEEYKVFLLSRPDSPQAITLDTEVENDLKTENGRNWAFTLGQRYVSLEGLKRSRTTSSIKSFRPPGFRWSDFQSSRPIVRPPCCRRWSNT
jgi:hypothetical protein